MFRGLPSAVTASAADSPAVSASTRMSIPRFTAAGIIIRASCPPPTTPTRSFTPPDYLVGSLRTDSYASLCFYFFPGLPEDHRALSPDRRVQHAVFETHRIRPQIRGRRSRLLLHRCRHLQLVATE